MRRFRLFSLCLVLLLAVGVMLSACGGNTESSSSDDANAASEKTAIKIGVSTNTGILAESGVSSLEAMGYEVEIITFDDFFLPDTALDEGSIDANIYQHIAFLNNYNEENGTNLIMLEPCLYNFYNGFYSRQADSLEELPEGGKIGIANDASNIDHNMKILDEYGLITLTDEERDLYTVIDIVDNPKNFEFVQLDKEQRVAAIDELAGMFCSSVTMFICGLDPTADLLFQAVDNDYAIGMTINADTDSVDEQWVKDMIAAYTSDEAYQYVLDNYKGAYVKSDGFAALSN